MWHCVTLCDVVWRCVTLCDVVWRCVTLCDVMWCCVTSCDVVWRHVTLCGVMWRCVTSSKRKVVEWVILMPRLFINLSFCLLQKIGLNTFKLTLTSRYTPSLFAQLCSSLLIANDCLPFPKCQVDKMSLHHLFYRWLICCICHFLINWCRRRQAGPLFQYFFTAVIYKCL